FEEIEKRRNDEVFGENHLVHGDFNPTNILINGGEVSGVLDWEWSHSGIPYMDIGNLLRNTEYSYHNKIKRGLKKGGMILPDDWIRRAEYIDLSSHLEFLTSNRSNDFKRKCVKWINNFISKYS
ncbi:MAG: phosphotransferase, partial [candidate division Zixibacteria bacterium]|nr:phosphotransferase [candidate division Zixibacteria bacterium]